KETVEIAKSRSVVVNCKRITVLDVVFRHVYITIAQNRTYKFRFVNGRKNTDDDHQKENRKRKIKIFSVLVHNHRHFVIPKTQYAVFGFSLSVNFMISR